MVRMRSSLIWLFCTMIVFVMLLAAICPRQAEAANSWVARPSMTGDWGGMRTQLNDRGISPYFVYTALLFTNVAGGLQTGARLSGFMRFGFDVDLDKFWGWKGSSLHLGWQWWNGPQPSEELVGNFGPDALSGWEASNAFRFYDSYFQQKFHGGDYLIKIGQLAADADFMISEYAGPAYNSRLLNAAFGALPLEAASINAPVYPLAAPGIYMYAKPTLHWFLRAAVYTADAGEDVDSNLGFGWDLGNNAQYAIFYETGLDVAPWQLPANYALGGYYDTATFSDFRTGKTVQANYGVYALVDQALQVDEQGEPTLGVWIRAIGAPQEARNSVVFYGDAGIMVFGLLPSRSQDLVGIGVGTNRFSEAFRRASRARGQPVRDQETCLEVTYEVVVTPWLSLQPDFQFIFDPVVSQRDAYVFGLQAVFTL